MKKEKMIKAGTGLLIGFVNGFLGTGGGIIAVPLLKRMGLTQKESHINAVAVILPICLVSAFLYVFRGDVTFKDAWIYIPTGIIGALIGTYIIKKISPLWLKRIFGALIIYAGVRLLMK
jgi:uncharacterized membrane protein YfcA